MRFLDYLKDKLLLCILHGVCMGLLTIFLRLTSYPLDYCAIILLCWCLILFLWLFARYFSRKTYFNKLISITDNLDKRYLLGELMPVSFSLEDRLYREIIRKSNKSVIERIRKIEDEKREYREYIESWVHEIKAPITAIELNCTNNRDERGRYIATENRKVENYVDMALYYARLDEVYKDYIILETDLSKAANDVFMKNKDYLIMSRIQAEVDCPDKVFTDKKWIEFILNQLVQNSAKYSKGNAHIRISTEKGRQGVLLKVRDNGIGIKKEELPRIFEKGFTGTNGREVKRSTGMGLYLCERLCEKLGISISASSLEGEWTEVVLEFPISTYLADYRS